MIKWVRRHWKIMVPIYLLCSAAFFVPMTVSILDNIDTAFARVESLIEEHKRLCNMYALFGPLPGAEEINPRDFPACGGQYSKMTGRGTRVVDPGPPGWPR